MITSKAFLKTRKRLRRVVREGIVVIGLCVIGVSLIFAPAESKRGGSGKFDTPDQLVVGRRLSSPVSNCDEPYITWYTAIGYLALCLYLFLGVSCCSSDGIVLFLLQKSLHPPPFPLLCPFIYLPPCCLRYHYYLALPDLTFTASGAHHSFS